jgi:hypothetical protein
LRCWLYTLEPRRTARPRNFRGFRRELTRKYLISLRLSIHFFGGNCNLLELFGRVAKIFWNFLELLGASWKHTQAMQGAGGAGLKSERPIAIKTFL